MKNLIRKGWRTVLLFAVLALRMYFNSHGQMIKPAVISNAGSSFLNPNNHVMLEWVIGESCVTTLLQANGGITQGLLQPLSIAAQGPLPVTLLYFNAKRLNRELVQLDWATATELNNYGFYIERKLVTQSNFARIKFLPSSAPGGNSFQLISYMSPDSNNYKEISYYRLAQVDINGTTKYSAIKLIPGVEDDITLRQWPNPSHGSFYVLVNNSTMSQGNLFDASGKLVQGFTLQGGVQSEINVAAKGVYILQVSSIGGERIGSRKIVVE